MSINMLIPQRGGEGRDWSVLKLPLLVSLIRGFDERLNKTERSRKQIKCSFIRKAAIVIEFPSLRMLLTGGSASFIPFSG